MQEKWVTTRLLFERFPCTTRQKQSLIKLEFLGKKEIPEELPFIRALAVVAGLAAHQRGLPQMAPTVAVVLALQGDPKDYLLVYEGRRSRPEVVESDEFVARAAIVIELDYLVEIVQGCIAL